MKNFFSKVLILSAVAIAPFFVNSVQAQGLEAPSDVRNVSATAGDKAIELTWDDATDEDGVVVKYKVYYGVTPVTDEGGTYDQEVDTQSDDTTFEVRNLVNNDTYYFGVTAVDDQGNESDLYSVEISAIPTSGSTPVDASPILQNAVHTAPNKILVVMSEPVKLADPATEAFDLTEDATGASIPVLNVQVNSEQVTLIIDPSVLVIDEFYRVTATTGVTDFDGNPVSSGIVDSVEFKAQENFAAPLVEEEPAEEEETLLEEEPVEDVLVPEEPETTPVSPDDFGSFFLDNSDSGSDTANFIDGLLAPDNLINNLETVDPEPVVSPVVKPDAESVIKDEISGLGSAPDLMPPQDARSLNADTSNFESGEVMVSWQPAFDIEGDIKDQILYTRVGLGAWDKGLSLGKDISQAKMSVQPNQNYQVRLVTVDLSGNESFGAPFEFSTTLSQSGAGQGTVVALSVIALLGFFFLFAGGRRA